MKDRNPYYVYLFVNKLNVNCGYISKICYIFELNRLYLKNKYIGRSVFVGDFCYVTFVTGFY